MPAENGMPESEDVRKKALLRLAVAGIVTAAALGGLWWLDQTGGDQKKGPPEVKAPAPIVSAPQTETPSPATEPAAPGQEETGTPPQEPAAEPEQQAATPAQPARSGELPPPPRVSNMPARAAVVPHAAPAQPPAAIVPAAPARPAAVLPPPPPVAGKGFVVQLGVFSNPDNARELVEKLNKQGIRAHLEARVQIGPFLNRQEAEKAQVEMRKLGYNALVTLPYPVLPATK